MTYWDKLPPTPGPRCGTTAGYTRHRRRWEFPCEDCREAMARRMARYRSEAGEGHAVRQRIYSRASHSAQSRLAGLHPEEYAALYAEELSRFEAEARANGYRGPSPQPVKWRLAHD